jgi:hypothetical protein
MGKASTLRSSRPGTRVRGSSRRTDAIDQALDVVAFRDELAKGVAAVRRSGGVDDVLARRRKA